MSPGSPTSTREIASKIPVWTKYAFGLQATSRAQHPIGSERLDLPY
jgi:hypothetical protein